MRRFSLRSSNVSSFKPRPPPRPPLFPYTTLFRSVTVGSVLQLALLLFASLALIDALSSIDFAAVGEDRKSTRLNSSHPSISYAVFCLKKKKKDRDDAQAA